jgi:hypothetical protein
MTTPRFWEWNGICDYRYQAVETADGGLRLWFLMPGETVWEIGHTKRVNGRMALSSAADVMQRFTLGIISHADYNEILP